ncbi:MAG: alkaline phosphatase family protein [Desulfobulbaceae bacterium]|nr:alkaline phosphatase family protein [Desulfobulbaceae bacterium]
MNRREFIAKSAILGLGASFAPATKLLASALPKRRKTLVLGIDGMDIKMATAFMRLGLLPNFSKLAKAGGLTSAATSFPPQSPVAWSSFSVGAWPSVHGIYDFIHRDPATMTPYLSTSRVSAPERTFSIGNFEIPLSAGKVTNLRQGRPFWDYLADYDIPATVHQMPGNFPCLHDKVDMLSGMGTPDLRGGYGSFTLVTTVPPANSEKITGGMILPIEFQDDYAEALIAGPDNTLRQGHPTVTAPIKIWRDRSNSVVRLLIQDQEFVLNQGDWTDWLQLSFTMLNHLSEVTGICKLYIKSVHPEFSMYVSPINIDPANPVLPIFSSPAYGKDLTRHLGPFHTKGLPADTKALSYDILNNDEYLDLTYQLIAESRKGMEYEISKLASRDEGFLFYYFSSLDQDSHMFWRTIDPESPLYTKELEMRFGHTLKDLYVEMDKCLGRAMNAFDIRDPNFQLLVTSDHGFGPFRRQVNLNSWLHEQGFLNVNGGMDIEEGEYFADVNWDKTAAYALGINAIYLNLAGRERFGSLSNGQANSVLAKIRQGLLALRDPKNGYRVVTDIYMTPEAEKRANPHAPDLIIGWNLGYRTSWTSILGSFARETISDNDDRWSGDHCIDPSLVPAILFSNRKITKAKPTMLDITATILSEHGIPIPAHMTGSSLYQG